MSAGTWSQLTVSNQNTVLGDTNPGGSGSDIHYMNQANYIPQSDRIQIIGADHGAFWTMGIVEYDLATSAFIEIATGSLVEADTSPGTGPGHGYGHAAVNPTTGDAYQVHYGQPVSQKIKVTKRSQGSSSFATTLPTTMPVQAGNITWGACWWSGTFSGNGGSAASYTGGGSAGAQGCLMVYNQGNSNGSSTDGVMNAYNPLTDTWFFCLVGASPSNANTGTYHAVAAYSSVYNCMVYGGCNGATKKIWRLSSTGVVTQLPDIPNAGGYGIQRGNLVCDPATGKFLVMGGGELWELDPSGSGNWTLQTGSRVPPSAVADPLAPEGLVSAGLAPYGVIAYIGQSTVNDGQMWLYKHA